jgi:hypothetical protein
MKNIKDRGRTNKTIKRVLSRTLAAGAVLLFSFALTFGSQDGYSTPAKGKWMAGITLGGGFPLGEFRTNIGNPGGGLDLSFGTRLGNSPFIAGFDLGYIIYGLESRHDYLSGSIPVQVEVETTNNILQALLYLKFQPFNGRVRPYIEALGGFSYLFTDTTVYDNDSLDSDEIASDINFDDGALAFGAGAGMEIRLGRGWRGVHGVRRPEYFLDIKVRYLAGGTAQYLRKGSIVYDGGEVTYLYNESKTNLVSAQIGLSASF